MRSLNKLPALDLHGYDEASVRYLVNDFIQEQLELGQRELMVIHGRGEFILKTAVCQVLKHHSAVKCYYQPLFNNGCTIIELRVKR